MLMGNCTRYAGIDPCEICNGIGFGVTLFTQGCPNHCEGCHNPSTWDPSGGMPFDENAMNLLVRRCADPNIRRLTISGGEPFTSLITPYVSLWFKLNYPYKKLWVYTGFLYEDIVKESVDRLEDIDVLVDGPFVLAERDITLAFRGSRNQRIIDVPASLQAGHVVELEVT